MVERIDTAEKKVYVDRMRDQIKDAPEYDDAFAENAEYREQLGNYYTGAVTEITNYPWLEPLLADCAER